MEEEYKCIVVYWMLTREVISQSLAVLGAPTSIDSSVLVQSPVLEGSIKLISWDLVQRDFISVTVLPCAASHKTELLSHPVISVA